MFKSNPSSAISLSCISISEPLFNPSKIFNAEGVRTYDDYRTSTSANLRRQHTPVVKCLEQRFAEFQGNIDVRCVERFQVVKYIPGQQVWEIILI